MNTGKIGMLLFCCALSAFSQPVIVQNPESLTKAPGTIATFSIAASGATPLTYQWQFNGQDIPNARGRTLRFVTAPSRAGDYSVVIHDQTGAVRSSDAASLQVKPRPRVVVQPRSARVQEHTTAVFEVQLNDSGPYTYINWYNFNSVEGLHAIPEGSAKNVHTTRLEIPNALNAFNYNGTYWIAVSNEVGGTISRKVKLAVVGPPQLSSGPENRAVAKGRSVGFSVTVVPDNAGTKRFQWFKDGQPLAGGIARTLFISRAQPAQQGTYYCVVTSPGGSTQSSSATLTVF